MNKNERLDYHQKFKELAALMQRGALSHDEQMELNRHLRVCDSCQQAYAEYALISTEGMPFLAAAYGYGDENEDWDDDAVRNKLLARVRNQGELGQVDRPSTSAKVLQMGRSFYPGREAVRWAGVAIAACVLIAVGAYHLGSRGRVIVQQNPVASFARTSDAPPDRKAADDLVASQTAQISRLQLQASDNRLEVARLREALHAAEMRSSAMSTVKAQQDDEFRRVSEQRDQLVSQLHDAEQNYQLVQAELTTLRTEHDRLQLHTTSLQSKVEEVTASSRDLERRLRDDEGFLSSDRDIRELMGARKLYIADVFDVDSGSRTRKPFGRVFYTQSKSLIFYAFDLDHQPGVKTASAFQVWGQRDVESGQKDHATNLGILYMDSESNRRWVLRLDDPKQLSEIDAVFVTVEPHGGSQKPTGKPFLYALLRREANHP
jgi:uncharacterized protein YdcH (DUF465 family)